MTSDHAMYAEKTDAYFGFARTEIASLLPDRVNRVLEIGCGNGATLKWLRSQRNVQYAVGIEMVPEAAERAAAVFDLVLSGNVETMELPAGTFDLIIALDVLEHLVDPWLIVRRLHAVLNPDGAIVASIPNVGHYSVCVPLALQGQWNYTKDGLLDRTHLRFFTRQTAVDLLTSSGLVMEKVEYQRRWPGWAQNPSLPGKGRWYLQKFLNWISPRHLFDFQFLIRVKSA
jgi:SAM-dependent methyltransferase